MSFRASDLDSFLRGYIACALWSSTDESTEAGGEPLEANYTAADIDRHTSRKCKRDCIDFMRANEDDLKKYCKAGNSMERAGHDFWLTRNRHGAGYWDRGLGQLGNRLADAARVYGSVDLYVGDDSKVHL